DTSNYYIPVGEDSYDGDTVNFEPFRSVFLQLVSYGDDVTVTVRNNCASNATCGLSVVDGAQLTQNQVSFQLDKGDSWASTGYLNTTRIAASEIRILRGSTVTADGPLAAVIMAGGVDG